MAFEHRTFFTRLHQFVLTSDGDRIADAKGSFKKDDQTADEIGHDFLQSKADADARGGNQPLDA